MNAALRLFVSLSAAVLVGAAVAGTTGDAPSHWPIRVGDSGVAVIEWDNYRSRLLRVPGFEQMSPSLSGWIDDVDFLDRRTGWIVSSDCGMGRGTIVRTDDGRRWRMINTAFSHTCNAGATLDLDFVDRRNGWLVWFEPTGRFSELYRSRDGGATWRRINGRRARPGVERISFATRRRGWGAGSPPASGPARLLETSDAGRTWRAERQLPVGRFALPVVSGGRAVVAATVRWNVLVYVSSNSGRQWRIRTRLRFGGPIGEPQLASPVPGVWWITAGSRRRSFLAVTADGGRTWTRSAPTVGDGSFSPLPTSAQRAWASSSGRLFLTTDAGRTWRPVRSPN